MYRNMLTNLECNRALEEYPDWPTDVALLKYSVEYKETPTALHAIWNSVNNILVFSNKHDPSTKALYQKLLSSLKNEEFVHPRALDAALYYISTHYVLQGCVIMGPSLFFDLYEMHWSINEENDSWFDYAARGALGLSAQGLQMKKLSCLRKFTFGVQVGEHNDKNLCVEKESENMNDHFSTISINLNVNSEPRKGHFDVNLASI